MTFGRFGSMYIVCIAKLAYLPVRIIGTLEYKIPVNLVKDRYIIGLRRKNVKLVSTKIP